MDAKSLRLYRNLRFRIIYKGQVRLQSTSDYQRMSAEFAEFVRGIEDPVKRQIVVMYYRDVRSDICIADKLHYSESQIKRLKRSAVHAGGCGNREKYGD